MNDKVFGIFILLLSVFYIFSAYIVEESFISDHIGPKIYPYIVSFFLITSSLFLIFKPDTKPIWPKFSKLFEILLCSIMALTSLMFVQKESKIYITHYQRYQALFGLLFIEMIEEQNLQEVLTHRLR